jgi:hypothetical protein
MFPNDIKEPSPRKLDHLEPNQTTSNVHIQKLRRQMQEQKDEYNTYKEALIKQTEAVTTLNYQLSVLNKEFDDHKQQNPKPRERRHTKHVDLSNMPLSTLAIIDSMSISLKKYTALTRLFGAIPPLRDITKARDDLNKAIEEVIRFKDCPDGTGGTWANPIDVAGYILERHPLPNGVTELRLLLQIDGAKVSRSQNMVNLPLSRSLVLALLLSRSLSHSLSLSLTLSLSLSFALSNSLTFSLYHYTDSRYGCPLACRRRGT